MENYDAWKMAGTEPVNHREYFGQINMECLMMVFPGEKGSGQRPEVYNPQTHKGKRPFVQIKATLNPLAEMQLSRETSCNWQNYSADWLKITMPSIRKLGFVDPDGGCDLRKFDQSWVRFEFIPGFTKNKDPEKPNYKTMQFLEVYPNEDACRKAYVEANGEAEEETPKSKPQSTSDSAVASALVFVRSIAENAMRSGGDVADAVETFLTNNAQACAGLKIDSPEIQALLKEFDDNPPF